MYVKLLCSLSTLNYQIHAFEQMRIGSCFPLLPELRVSNLTSNCFCISPGRKAGFWENFFFFFGEKKVLFLSPYSPSGEPGEGRQGLRNKRFDYVCVRSKTWKISM